MGLHAHITQVGTLVEIDVRGDLSSHSIAQLEAIIDHFRARGCNRISLKASPRPASPHQIAQEEALAQARELVSEFAIRRQ